MIIFLGVIAYILGLYFLRNNIILLCLISLAFLIFVFMRFGVKKGFIILAIFGGGILIANIPMQNNSATGEYYGMVVETHENYFLFQSGVEKFYIYEKSNERELGDFLIVYDETPSDVAFTTYESQFDFGDYLANKRVTRSLSGEIEVKFETPFRIKAVKEKFVNSFDDETGFLIDAFLFNNKSYESRVLSTAQNLNIIFLFASSGIYLSFLIRGSKALLRLVLDDKKADAFALFIWLPYLIFVFPRIGLMRVAFVYVFRYINNYFLKKKISSLTLLSSSMAFFLTIDFSFAYQSGFYIGFALSFLFLFIGHSLERYKKRKRRILIWPIIYLFMIPLSAFGTGALHIFGLLYQVLLIPVNELYVLISIISFYTFPFANILGGFTWLIEQICSALNYCDQVLYLGDYGIIYSTIYYILLVFGLYLFESQRWRHLTYCGTISASLVIFALLPIKTLLLNGVYFINVGQGDSILIQNGMHAVMIDTGGNLKFDMAQETLIPFLRKRQIYKLDALITTHSDFDHSGAASSLIDNFPVGQYLTKADEFPYQIGSIYLDNINTYKTSDDNDSSLVFNLDFMHRKWLLMGDASSEVEKFLIDDNQNLDCDILKAGHHGSKTSSCEEFIKVVTPEVAIISVGKKNYYGHPNAEVIERLKKYGVAIRRTDVEGTISYVSIYNV